MLIQVAEEGDVLDGDEDTDVDTAADMEEDVASMDDGLILCFCLKNSVDAFMTPLSPRQWLLRTWLLWRTPWLLWHSHHLCLQRIELLPGFQLIFLSLSLLK